MSLEDCTHMLKKSHDYLVYSMVDRTINQMTVLNIRTKCFEWCVAVKNISIKLFCLVLKC